MLLPSHNPSKLYRKTSTKISMAILWLKSDYLAIIVKWLLHNLLILIYSALLLIYLFNNNFRNMQVKFEQLSRNLKQLSYDFLYLDIQYLCFHILIDHLLWHLKLDLNFKQQHPISHFYVPSMVKLCICWHNFYG